MSGLTLGLMSLDVVEMEVLQRSGTQKEQKQAGMISFLSLCHIFIRPHCFHCLCIVKIPLEKYMRFTFSTIYLYNKHCANLKAALDF